MKIRFVGYALDATGYGEFARLVLRALHAAGHDLSLGLLSMREEPSERFGAAGKMVEEIMSRSRRGGGPADGDAEVNTPRKESSSLVRQSLPAAGAPARREGSDLIPRASRRGGA